MYFINHFFKREWYVGGCIRRMALCSWLAPQTPQKECLLAHRVLSDHGVASHESWLHQAWQTAV